MTLLLALLACSGRGPTTPTDDGPTPTDVATPTDVPTPAPTGDTAPPEPTADTGPFPPDCSQPPAVPASFGNGNGFGNAEDFDFDFDGRHVSVIGGNLQARSFAGQVELLAPNVGFDTACTRMLPDGRFVVCQVGAASLLMIDPVSGARQVIATGLAYPNGAEVDLDGYVYVAEQNGGRVQRIDPQTSEAITIANNLVSPNGVIFSPDYQRLYVGSFGGGQIYAIDRTGPDSFDPPFVFAQSPGPDGGFDGINVDACGNVYFTEFIQGRVHRLEAGTANYALVAELPSSWIPNMRWGNGMGGTRRDVLYVSDRDQGRLFGLEIGLEGKASFTPPP